MGMDAREYLSFCDATRLEGASCTKTTHLKTLASMHDVRATSANKKEKENISATASINASSNFRLGKGARSAA
jgi:hypothetical protein